MRIVLLTDEYLPRSTRVHAKMMHELAVGFKKKGHDPIIITPGSPNQETRLVEDYYEGITVWRFKSGYTKGVGNIRRAINEWLLPIRAWLAVKSNVKKIDFDICINYSPTIFFGTLANYFKQRGAYVYLILRDMFPQWIIDNGIIKEKSLTTIFFRYYEKLNYDVADCIGVQSKANKNNFVNKFPSYKNIKILKNWASKDVLSSNEYNHEYKISLGIQDKFIFFYGGNIGHAQDMKNIMKLARNLKTRDEAHFLIIGQGDEYNLINDLKQNWKLENVTILPSVSQKEFKRILATIDVGLFSLSYAHTSHNFPGKLLGYMAESKPILGSVNPENDLLKTINDSNSGLVYINGEDELLSKAAIRLIDDDKFRNQCGFNARDLLLREFSVDSAVELILAELA